MKFGLMLIAATTLAYATPASAATFVQTKTFINQNGQNFFDRFDTTLGTLTSVSVNYTVSQTVGFELLGDPTYRGPVLFTASGTYVTTGLPNSSGDISTSFVMDNPGAQITFPISFTESMGYFGSDVTYFVGSNPIYFAPGINALGVRGTYPGGSISSTRALTIRGTTLTGSISVVYGYVAAATAVPEPASWAMMILGVGAVGFAMRRSRKQKVSRTVRFV